MYIMSTVRGCRVWGWDAGVWRGASPALIAAADLVIASARTRFWMPELKGGLWLALPLPVLALQAGLAR